VACLAQPGDDRADGFTSAEALTGADAVYADGQVAWREAVRQTLFDQTDVIRTQPCVQPSAPLQRVDHVLRPNLDRLPLTP
jgi:hypothetical protein